MMLYIKYESSGSCTFRQDDLKKNAFWKPIFWPSDQLMQPIRTIWKRFVGDHPGTIPVEFGQIPISGSREAVVWTRPYIIQCKIGTPGAGSILTPGT